MAVWYCEQGLCHGRWSKQHDSRQPPGNP